MKTLVLVLGLLTAFGPLSIDMYLPALSHIAADLGASIDSAQLSLSSFFIGLAAGQVFYGPITDKFGRRRPLFIGLVIYIIASLACARSESAHALVIMRFLQALGSCAGMVISKAVVRDKFAATEAAKTFSLLMLIMGVAPILAPSLGSSMLSIWSWQSIFYFLAAVGLIGLVAVYFFLPETLEHEDKSGIKESLKNFPHILKDREFLTYGLSSSLAYGGMFSYITGSAFVFMEYFDFSPGQYSALFGMNAGGIILSSQLNRLVLRKVSPRQALSALYPIIATIGIALGLAGALFPKTYTIIPLLFLFLAGMGMMFPNATACALATQKRAGSASALLGTMQFGISAPVSACVSLFHNETAAPMTVTVGLSALFAFAIYKLLQKD